MSDIEIPFWDSIEDAELFLTTNLEGCHRWVRNKVPRSLWLAKFFIALKYVDGDTTKLQKKDQT